MQQSKPQIANTIDVLYLNKGSKMYIQDIFPTPVGMFDYGKPSDKELETINSFEMMSNELANSHTVDLSVLDNEALKNIKDFIEASLKTYLSVTLCPSPDMTHYITQSWVNIQGVNGSHTFHSHMNAVATGTFYLAADGKKDSITFIREGKDVPFMHEVLTPDTEKLSAYNATEWAIPVNTGNLFLFPSELAHGVKNIDNRTSDRISLSFNIYVKGWVSKGGPGNPPVYLGT